MAHHLGSEAVVSEEDVADSGDQDAGCHLVDELRTTCSASSCIAAVRDGSEPDQHTSHDDDCDDTCCYPTNYIHHELLSGLTILVSSGSTSSGAKYRYRPYESGISTSGSSSTMTPTYCSPSTSSCTDVTRAVLPAKKMSCASARRHGRSRTRLPRRHPHAVHQHGIDVGTDGVVGHRIPPIDTVGDLRDEPRRSHLLVQLVESRVVVLRARQRAGCAVCRATAASPPATSNRTGR